MADEVAQLMAAGFTIDPANEGQAAVLRSLTESEVQVLLKVKERVAGTADIEGHLLEPTSSGGWLW
jgi:hypothetical protein